MKNLKKIFAVVLAVLMLSSVLTACGTGSDELTVGFIFLHDEQSTYDKNFMEAAKKACEEMGVKYVQKTNVPESNDCYDKAVELIKVDGCDIIFADSFGHEEFLIKAAKEYPDVQFCHATGTMAHTAGLDNFHNAFASIYEGRYLAGIAAGMKLKELQTAGLLKGETPKMGYVGAFTFAEVISGYTSFYLGAKSVCPDVTMDVKFTGSWYDEQKEKEAAVALIAGGCDLISQHADSMGAPTACQDAKVPNVSYNGSTLKACPDSFIVSSRIDWTPYFKYMIKCVQDGTEIDKDWTGDIATGSVVLTEINDKVAAPGTKEAIEDAKAKLQAGTLHVFDTANFTVNGETKTSYKADVNSNDNIDGIVPDTEAIDGGIFRESKHRSAPYFDMEIDGITLLDRNYGEDK